MNKSFQLLRFLFFCIDAGIVFVGNAQPTTPPTAYSGSLPVNHVRTWTAVKPETNANNITLSAGPTDFKVVTQYFDGLGRPLQTVAKQGSLVTGGTTKDLVVPVVYDAYARESLRYLPFASTGSDGLFKTDPFQQQVAFYNTQLSGQTGEFNIGTSNLNWAYSQTQFEASPLNRVNETFAPGSSWVGTSAEVLEQNRHSGKAKYWLNTATDNVKIWKVDERYIFTGTEYSLRIELVPNGSNFDAYYTWANLPATANAITVRYRELPSGSWHTSTGSISGLPRIVSIPGGEYEFGVIVHHTSSSGIPDQTVPATLSFPQIKYTVPGSYASGSLYKEVTFDEHGKQVIQFNDKHGKVVLKKVQLTAAVDNGTGSGHLGWLCTYYVYDDRDNLSLVIQPAGVVALDGIPWPYEPASNSAWTSIFQEQCFQYMYDSRKRLIKKKTPGTYGGTFMVYDKKNRLVMTQDGNLEGQGKWIVTVYDGLGRAVKTLRWGNANGQQYHAAQAAIASANYPDLTGQTYDVLTETFYDSYDWLGTNGNPFTSNRSTIDDWAFYTPSNTSYPYPQPLTQSYQLTGLVTGTKVNVLETSQYLFSINYYDNKNRIVQSIEQNMAGGQIVTTNQYSFTGQLLLSYQLTSITGTGATQPHAVRTKNDYDALGRVITVKKEVFTVNTVGNTGEKIIAQYEYDALGQLKKKKLAPAYNNNAGLETLDYDYNVRGWMLGMNREFAKNDNQTQHFFGYELGYDKSAINLANGTNVAGFQQSQYNGNIAGIIWKSTGDNVLRKYDYGYDPANRLLKGVFIQFKDGAWSNSGANYDVKMGNGIDATSAYDANGNIQSMTQYGWKLGGSDATPIDELTYSYFTGSNKLKAVSDAQSDPNTRLGDFKDGNNTAGTNDYSYDNNGNMTLDNNKNINSITYNYLNLPQLITVTGKGTIEYIYTAGGVKLKKVTTDATVNPTKVTTTLYVGESVYVNNELQFTGMEEGKIRFAKATTATCPTLADRFVFDFNITDHLGNVRMVLTDQQESICYIPATVEDARYTTEDDIYNIVDGRRIDKATVGASSVSSFENKVYRVHGGLTGEKTGLGVTLKVMSGDKVRITAESFYAMPGGGAGTPATLGLTELLTAFAGSPAVSAAGHSGLTAGAVSGAGSNTTLIPDFLNDQAEGSNNARAFVNWILFDEQFKFVDGSADPVQPGGGYKPHDVFINTPALASKNGYLYVYVSNESNLPVYFDNLAVTHIPGPILEETHYYPFGLIQAGISSKALAFGGPENKNEKFQTQAYNNELEIGMYEFKWRDHDPQIGRFWQLDPLADKYRYNSAYAFSENKVIAHRELEGLESWTVNAPDGTSETFSGPYANQQAAQQEFDRYHRILTGESFSIGPDGMISSNKVDVTRRVTELEQKAFKVPIRSIVLHQTAGRTAQSALGAFKSGRAGVNYGTHFLIDKDGTIMQTASLLFYTYHVGKTRKKIYPGNSNSVGIEVVSMYDDKSKEWEAPTPEQTMATAWLTNSLRQTYNIPKSEVYTHIKIGYKTPGEGDNVLNAIQNYLFNSFIQQNTNSNTNETNQRRIPVFY